MVTLAEQIEETLMEATEAITVVKVTEVAISLPEVRPPIGNETILRLTTGTLKTTKADTKKLIGAFRSASLVAPKRPYPTVTSSNLFVPPLLRNVAPTLPR